MKSWLTLCACLCCNLCSSFNGFASNSHYSDNDTWNVLFINETKTQINLHPMSQRLWDSSQIPDNIIIEPCSEYKSISTYTLLYPYTQQTVQPGFLKYNLFGSYTGSITLVGNNPDAIDTLPLGTINGQAQSGSADWIGSGDLPICQAGQVTNCIETGFYVPKNIATFPFGGDTSQSLRMASDYVSPDNNAFVVFEPHNKDDVCPLQMDALQAWITLNLPTLIAFHKNKIYYPHENASLAQIHPDWNFNDVSGGIYPISWGLDKKRTFPEPSALIDHPIVKVEGKASNFKTQKIYSAESDLKNNSDVIQNMSTSAFSRAETMSNTTETTQNWFTSGSVSFTAGVEIGDDEAKASFSTTIGITAGGGGSASRSCTYSVTDTVSAPVQVIMVPGHTEAVARWVLEKMSGDENFDFYAPLINQKVFPFHLAGLMTKDADEWHHLGTPQQHRNAQILNDDLVEVDLYSLILPAGTVLPFGITKLDDGTLYMSGAGTLKAEGIGGLEMELTEFPLDKQGNRTGAPASVQYFPVKAHLEPARLNNSGNPCS